MNEIVYGRSPSPGEVEIVVAKDHQAEVYPLSAGAIADLLCILASAAGHRLGNTLSQTWEKDSRRNERHEVPGGNPSRHMGDDHHEGIIYTPWGYMEDKDKNHRKYGRRA